MKITKLSIIALFAISMSAYAQEGRVGINTTTPKTTMDVNGKTDGSGVSLATDITGLQAPRLTRKELTDKGDALYGKNQKGAIVYITDIAAGDTASQRVNITSTGYYYFDGIVWVKIATGSEEPWNVATTTTPATTNTQDIYQMGKVGIGTNNPSNLLEVNKTTGVDTGLKLPNGASSGKVLTSDIDGNAIWQSSDTQYQTIVYSSGNYVTYTPTAIHDWVKVTNFTNVVDDDVATIYGSGYGWSVANQEYTAPRAGKYRISVNLYWMKTTVTENWRAAIQLNNSSNHAAIESIPFSSITTSPADQNSFFSGIAKLNAGDKISLKIANFSSAGPMAIWAGRSHTLIFIEAL